MPWKPEMVVLLRALMDDLYEPYEYTDDKLEELLVYAATFVITEVSFDTDYTIDVLRVSISPDPTSSTTKDMDFMTLVALRAAVILSRGETKAAAAQSIKITDGPSVVDATMRYNAKKQLSDDLLEQYEKTKLRYQMGDGSVGKAVLSPYTQENLAARNPLRRGD